MAWTKEQELAINKKNTNIIVSAGAGSGKTAVLTARTMRILNENTHINELLILTFTKAAANEMKERIRNSIKKSLSTNLSLKKELELIDQAYITTFDSFALSVVKKYHYLLNISNDIEITAASIIDMKKTEIMDETFNKYYEHPTEQFNKLIYDFCVKDDKDLKSSLLKIATKIDSMPQREEYLSTYLEHFYSQDFINKCLKDYTDIIFEKVTTINQLAENLSYIVDGSYQTKVIEQLSILNNCHNIDDFYLHINEIKLPSLPRGSEEEVKKSKEKLNDSLKELKEIISTYQNTDSILNNINRSKEYLKAILPIIIDYLNSLHDYKAQNNIYDFQDIALLSIKVLKENELVREELKSSFKEIMIDEYQDTNDIQETFISMIANNNIYMVGDIKQSIYRFRNANPYIFKSKYDNYSLNHGGYKIDLVKNFRSRREVLANINEVFNLIMDDKIGGAAYQQSHQMVYGNTSYIEEGLTDYDYNYQILEYQEDETNKYSKEEIEIFTIAKDIKEKISSHYQIFDKDSKRLKDISYQDFVILMDRTTDFDLYKKIFEYLGIPLTLYKDENLNNSDDIFIIKNIIDYIVRLNTKTYDQNLKYSFTSIARSYLFRLPDSVIFECFQNDNFKDNIIYNTFIELSNHISEMSISTLLENIINKTNMYEKLIEVGDINSAIARISYFFDIASNLTNLGYDIYKFRDFLDELLKKDYEIKYSASSTNSDSVKIMTIHKSKGLEYHICYYSGLYKGFNISDLKERFLFDNKYGIITPYFDEGIKDNLLKYLVKYNYLEEEVSEKIRLLYVALTRAKEKMILITPYAEEENNILSENKTIPLPIRHQYRSFSQILNSIKTKILKYYHSVDINTLDMSKNYLYNNKNLNKLNLSSKKYQVNEISIPLSNEVTSKHFSKDSHQLINEYNKKNMEFGLLFHESLEYLDFKNPDYSSIENNFISQKIKKFLANPLLSNIKNANIFKEYEFIYINNFTEYHGIIDLLIEYDNKIDIIDYKLNDIKDENYLKQLEGYKNYISSITDKPINIYLYSILSEKIEQLN